MKAVLLAILLLEHNLYICLLELFNIILSLSFIKGKGILLHIRMGFNTFGPI